MTETMDIDTLGRMMADGFLTLEKRMDGMDERFDGLEKRMDGLETRMLGLEQTMGDLRQEVLETNRHIDHIILPAIDSQGSRIKRLELKITSP